MAGLGSIGSLLGLAGSDPDAVTLLIDGKRFIGWTQMDLSFALDNVATISFAAPFEPDSSDFRAVFRPFSYKPLEVYVGEELLFTGTMMAVSPSSDPSTGTVSINGYSRPGVLADCTMPAAAYPLELNKLDLRQISERLCKSFELEVDFGGVIGLPFDRVALEPEKKVWEFLSDLAKQRGYVLSSTAEGRLLIWAEKVSAPIARITDEERPATKVTAKFEPQNFFSSITVIGTKKTGNKGAQYTVGNGFAADVVRPHAVKLEDTDTGGLPLAAQARLGRMLGNSVSYSVDVPTWRDPLGYLWAPNTMVSLYAPGAMVYSETLMLVRNVSLKASPDSMTASLDLVLPGSFNGLIPPSLPWDEPPFSLLNAIKSAL